MTPAPFAQRRWGDFDRESVGPVALVSWPSFGSPGGRAR